jgi:hypothetical protein
MPNFNFAEALVGAWRKEVVSTRGYLPEQNSYRVGKVKITIVCSGT